MTTTGPARARAASGADGETVIDVCGLRMHYGAFEAVRGIDLQVTRGEVVAFLGPNGAGKTTTVEILEGYRPRSAGTVIVLGEDPRQGGPSWRARIGVVLQESEPALAGTDGDRLLARAGSVVSVLGPLIRWAETRGTELADLDVRRPSLEDIYLSLTETGTGGGR